MDKFANIFWRRWNYWKWRSNKKKLELRFLFVSFFSIKKINERIIFWNNLFFFDKIWREKHKIPFASEAHKKQAFLAIFFEYQEDKFLEKAKEEILNKQEEDKFSYKDFDGKIVNVDFSGLQGEKMSKQEIDEEFDNLDLTDFE